MENTTIDQEIEVVTPEKATNILIGYCDGCAKIVDNFCTAYENPIKKCKLGCAFSPVAQAKFNSPIDKKRIGQQKQKKSGKKK